MVVWLSLLHDAPRQTLRFIQIAPARALRTRRVGGRVRDVAAGIVVFGSYFTMVHGVQQLAAEAARCSVAGLSEAERASLAESYITANAGSYPLLQPARLSVSAATSGSDVFVVTVNYDASGNFLLALPFVPSPPTTIVRSAAIPFGGF